MSTTNEPKDVAGLLPSSEGAVAWAVVYRDGRIATSNPKDGLFADEASARQTCDYMGASFSDPNPPRVRALVFAAPGAAIAAREQEKPTFDDYMYCKHCGRVIVWDDWSFTHLDGWANCRKAENPSELDHAQHCEPLPTLRISPQPKNETEAKGLPVLAFVVDGEGTKHAWRKGEPMPVFSVPAILASRQEAPVASGHVWLKCDGCGRDMRGHDRMGHCQPPTEAVAWQVRGIGRDDGPGEWRHADDDDVEIYRNTPDTWELRPLFAKYGNRCTEPSPVARGEGKQ